MRNPREIRALTGLRGVAAVFVAAYHFGPHITNKHFHWALHKGYLSVDVFFVLSGLVMAMTYQHWFLQGANPQVFARYMWLRIARIWPLYLTAVLAALAMQVFRGHALSDFTPSLLPNLLMIQGWGLAPSINPPLWSVSTEFVAYLLFPGLLILVARGRAAALSLTILGCLLLIVISAYSAPQTAGRTGVLDLNDPHSIFPVIRCVVGFTLGLAVWRVSQTPAGATIAASSKWGIATAALILGLMAANANDLLIYPLFPVLLLCLAHDKGLVARLLASPPVHWLGVLSFAIYALQNPFYGVAEPFVARFAGRLPDGISTLAYYGLIAAGLLLVGLAAHYLIERPSRFALRTLAGRRLAAPAVSG
jgi:peptidoglycan/LPS O-acetylase OafA/YrhL